MIITTKVTVFMPRDDVWNYFINPENLPDWIGGLEEYHHVSGNFREVGATGIYKFSHNKKVIEMREETLAAKEPEEHTVKFFHRDFDMIINNTLIDEGNNSTTFICNTEYRFKNLYWKVIAQILRDRLQLRQNNNFKRLKTLIEVPTMERV